MLYKPYFNKKLYTACYHTLLGIYFYVFRIKKLEKPFRVYVFIAFLYLCQKMLKYKYRHLIHIFYCQNKTKKVFKHHKFQFYVIYFEFFSCVFSVFY